MSVAYLGMEIDSSSSVVAKKRLQEFREEAKRTGETVDQVAARHDRAAAAVAKYGEELNKATQRAVNSAQAINSRLNVKDDFGSAQRSADIKAYGQELDSLRAKYNPLFVANRQYYDSVAEISAAHKAGAMSEKERTSAMDRARAVYIQQSKAIRELGTSAGLSTFQLANMSYQINDIATGLAMGQSPFMILAQQGGQVYQILSSSPQGVGGALKQVGSLLASILTPARLAVGGIAAIGVAGLMLQNSYAKAQIEIQNALRGAGAAAGVTVSDINRVADATAALSKLSVSEARTAAMIIASSGKITTADLADAVRLAEDLAKVLGTDVAEAAGAIAKSLKDPVKGAAELNERLGAFDAATMRTITNLRDQGRILEANSLLIRKASEGVKGAADNTTFWTKAWNVITNAVSNFGNALGNAMGTEEQQLESLLRQRQQLQEQFEKTKGSWLFSGANQQVATELADVNAQIEKLQKNLRDAADQAARAKFNLESIQVGKALDQLLPEFVAKQSLQNLRALADRSKKSDLADSFGYSEEALALARARAEAAANSFKSAQELAIAQTQLSIRAISARSPAERASIAYQQTMLMLSGQNISQMEKEQRASEAAKLAFRDAQFALSEAARERQLSAKLATGDVEIEIAAVGKSVGQAELLRLNWQSYADLRREADRNHTAFDTAEFERLKAINAEIARRKELLAAAQLRNDLSFERDQMFRGDIDANVAQRLRGAGLPVDLNSTEANLIRINEQMRITKDLWTDGFTGFGRSLREELANGAKGWDAVEKAGLKTLNRLIDKLIEMQMQEAATKLFKSMGGFNLFGLFGGSGSSAGVSIGGMAGFADGGYIAGPGTGRSDSITAKVSNGEYIVNAKATSRHRPLLDAINYDRAPRFADGGYVGNSYDRGSVAGNTYVSENHFHGPIDGSMKAYLSAQIKQSEVRARGGAVKDVQKYHQQTYGSMNK